MLLGSLLLVFWIYLQQQQALHRAQLFSLAQDIQQLAVKPAGHMAPQPVLAETTPLVENAPTTLAVLWQQLPLASALSPRMLQIAALAQTYNIPLNVGDYQWQVHQAAIGSTSPPQANRLQAGTAQSIEQFDMRFTIQTDYATSRRFMLEVLRRYPTMALTGLELRKNDTLQPMVETTLTFSMFIRGGQADAT